MEALAFELKGKTAFFKKPDVNANVYFTYSQIPKIALLGMLGAIAGYGGYHEQKRSIQEEGPTEENQYPEFYMKQQHLQIGIVPKGDRSYFSRKIQTFNNSVGYASGEAGNNLVVKEQWLEHPHWTIYIADDGSEAYQVLKEQMMNRKTTFVPYLGKNDHPADIHAVRIVHLQSPNEVERIHSLFQATDAELGGFARITKKNQEKGYFYRENLPYSLDEKLNSYVFKEMICTNRRVKTINQDVMLSEVEDRIVSFY
ncbi:type I-B CRISPR-associated protein Cas5b [Lederbergia sp. NSJ-179]|uniref:type I-B CRISPR-associated protein Cas5b n=1 Tax=Lederbergia sp. NSJ-179 TaxID=2931402 RepID=UPI001FD0B044|nr:type I-B CRISPR-associated protein Cas5b [Lederbergia sp. NSJ-179]MCJ7840939.1 type I-B CRISPR-associated protein Cas5b [Lederbergia sp. NSJ-179]